MSKSFPKLTRSDSPPQTDKLDKPIDKSSPGLTKEQILKSIYQKPMGPVKGRPIIGAGGYKPFKKPPEGTKAKPFKLSSHKSLRPPQTRSK